MSKKNNLNNIEKVNKLYSFNEHLKLNFNIIKSILKNFYNNKDKYLLINDNLSIFRSMHSIIEGLKVLLHNENNNKKIEKIYNELFDTSARVRKILFHFEVYNSNYEQPLLKNKNFHSGTIKQLSKWIKSGSRSYFPLFDEWKKKKSLSKKLNNKGWITMYNFQDHFQILSIIFEPTYKTEKGKKPIPLPLYSIINTLEYLMFCFDKIQDLIENYKIHP